MAKFKIGDLAKIVKKSNCVNDFNVIGAVVQIDEEHNNFSYCIKEDGSRVCVDLLRLKKIKKPKTLEVTIQIKNLKELKKRVKKLNKSIKKLEEFQLNNLC